MALPPPPGVYFYPTPEECVVDYLEPWRRGGEPPPGTGTLIFHRDVYGDSPDELRRAHPPATARGFDLKWYFLTTCELTGGRGNRAVKTGGYWKVEQKSKAVAEEDDDDAEPATGQRRTYGFHLHGRKTPWLMEELTGDDGGGRHMRGAHAEVRALCRIYVSPRAPDEEKREILGDDAVAADAGEGRGKRPLTPARVALDAAYYDGIAAAAQLMGHLIPGDHGQGAAAPPPPPPVFPAQAPPPQPVPYLHHTQAAPPPAIPYHHHPHPAPPQLVPAHHHPQAAPPPPAFPAHQPHPQAAPPPAVPRHHQPQAAPPLGRHHGQLAQHAHRHGQSMPTAGVHRYHHGRSLMLPQPPIFLDNYPKPAPPSFQSPKKEGEEEVFPAEKKPRLTYDAADSSPAPLSFLGGPKKEEEEVFPAEKTKPPLTDDGTAVQEPELAPAAPAAPPTPPQENAEKSPPPPQENAEKAPPPPLPEATLHPPSPGITFDASQEAGEALHGGFMGMEEYMMMFAAHEPAPDLGMIHDCQCPPNPDSDDLYPYKDLLLLDGPPDFDPPSR
ncbi:hypothetical protein ACP4OV_003781 [Aristida adscensionis]